MPGIQCHCGRFHWGIKGLLPFLNISVWMRMWTVQNSAMGHGHYYTCQVRGGRGRQSLACVKITSAADQLSHTPTHCPLLWLHGYIHAREYAKYQIVSDHEPSHSIQVPEIFLLRRLLFWLLASSSQLLCAPWMVKRTLSKELWIQTNIAVMSSSARTLGDETGMQLIHILNQHCGKLFCS